MAYLEYSYQRGLVKKGSAKARNLEAEQDICKKDLAASGDDLKVTYPKCESILTSILSLTKDTGRCVNMYDMRLDDKYPFCGMNWPPDLAHVTPYLHQDEVVKALHVEHKGMAGWQECNGQVGKAFKPKHSPPSIKILPEILEEVPILLFSGEEDLICSHIGTEDFIQNMEWNGAKGFELSPGTTAPRRDWTFEGQLAGTWQTARNLTYVLFHNASHMVPFDYPRRTRDMLDRFMRVDIGSIGGPPADSRIDGQKGVETSVGGHPNSTAAEQETQEKLDAERWAAYYRSGAIALVVVAILAVCFGWYVWQDRRRRAGYSGLASDGSGRLMSEHVMRRDVEATDFDENELDNMRPERVGAPRYSLGGVSSDEEEEPRGPKPAS